MSHERSGALDSLRAYAISLVLASHMGILMQGGLGNDIFFCLSGFLAAYPFSCYRELGMVSTPLRTLLNIPRSWFRRLIRILPLYYVIVFGVRWLLQPSCFTNTEALLGNLFFYNSYGHFWFLQNLLLMYICAPFILLLLSFGEKVMKKTALNDCTIQVVSAIVLMASAIIANRYLTTSVFYLTANEQYQTFRIGLFLIGMSFSYLYRAYRLRSTEKPFSRIAIGVMDLLEIGLFLLTILSSRTFLCRINPDWANFYVGWDLPVVCTILSGILILLLLINKDGLVSRIMNFKVFSIIGECSFGMYLIHMFLIPHINLSNKYKGFFALYIVSFCISYILHHLVEKPSVLLSKGQNIKEVGQYYYQLLIRNTECK